MRTTLELDNDVIDKAKDLAKVQGTTMGQVISDLLRLALHLQNTQPAVRNGVPLFVPNAGVPRPDLQLVNALRDDQ